MRTRTTLLCLMLTCAVSTARAQVLYGSIVGNVSDASDAPVPGATVTITNKENGQTRQVVTNESGGYSAPTLLSGIYLVKVGKEGFTTSTSNDISVTINSVSRVDIKLQVGAVTESVIVTAQSAVLQTDRPEVRSEVTHEALENL